MRYNARMLHVRSLPLVTIVVLTVGLLLFDLLVHARDAQLRIHGQTFNLQIASTGKAREQGLSGRRSLVRNAGMLFVFSQPGGKCFWMRGMNFPLDIIWLSGDKKVAHIQANVSPNTYPHQFCPSQPAQYVIELHAGAARAAGLRLGQTLRF